MSTSRPTAWGVRVLSLLAAATLLGCTPAARPDQGGTVRYQSPKDLVLGPAKLARIIEGVPASSPQRPLLADGVVTVAELQTSWSRLRSCLAAKGFVVSEPVMNPITNTDLLYTYSRDPELGATAAPDKPTDDELAANCEDENWNPVAQVYAANTPQRMNDDLAKYMADCLRREGVTTAAGASTFDAFVRDAAGDVEPARLRQANACLDQGVPQLYPDLPYFPRP
jgi:hypothetical protein